jgi:hypothetical protein
MTKRSYQYHKCTDSEEEPDVEVIDLTQDD